MPAKVIFWACAERWYDDYERQNNKLRCTQINLRSCANEIKGLNLSVINGKHVDDVAIYNWDVC